MQAQWAAVRALVDAERHAAVTAKLKEQLEEAVWWRDASIAYWQSVNKLPLPEGAASPKHPLSHYQAIHFEKLPGQP